MSQQILRQVKLVLRMLTIITSEQILRFIYTGIENDNSYYVTVAIGIGIENAKSCYVTADIETY